MNAQTPRAYTAGNHWKDQEEAITADLTDGLELELNGLPVYGKQVALALQNSGEAQIKECNGRYIVARATRASRRRFNRRQTIRTSGW